MSSVEHGRSFEDFGEPLTEYGYLCLGSLVPELLDIPGSSPSLAMEMIKSSGLVRESVNHQGSIDGASCTYLWAFRETAHLSFDTITVLGARFKEGLGATGNIHVQSRARLSDDFEAKKYLTDFGLREGFDSLPSEPNPAVLFFNRLLDANRRVSMVDVAVTAKHTDGGSAI